MIKKQVSKKIQCSFYAASCLILALLSVNGEVSAQDTFEEQVSSVQAEKDYSFSEAAIESITGDVYSDPSKWQALSYDNLFSKGWNKPWASPPIGSGGAPRQGWLNAYDGVFYRLGIAIFGWQHGVSGSDNYVGDLVNYTPLNQRFEVQTDISLVSGSSIGGQTNFGDFKITPRFILSESKDVTQSFNITFRTPTGNSINGNNVAAVTPQYQFWANAWKGLVVRGGVGFTVPYSSGGSYSIGPFKNITRSVPSATFDANLAIGYYFTPHDFTPIGDMVWYLSTNLSQAIDNRVRGSGTFVSLTPGFRTHLGQNWYLLGAVEVPVTHSGDNYQVQGGIMKVF